MQTVLITGANGFVGAYLVQLLSKEYRVIATGRNDNRLPFSHENIEYAELDFTRKENIDQVFAKYQPNVIVHGGAMSKPDDCELQKETAYTINVTGTQLLLDAAKTFNAFFVFLSTDFVFDGLKGNYKEEDETGTPVNYYGQTKLEAEQAVRQYPHSWSIIRTVLVYGKPISGRQNILTTVAATLQKGQSYTVFSDQVRTPTYVEDLVKAIKEIVDRRKTGTWHISGKDVRTPFEMAVATAKHLGLDEQLLKAVTRDSFSQPALRPLKTGFDISKAKSEWNFSPISFEEGLQKTFS